MGDAHIHTDNYDERHDVVDVTRMPLRRLIEPGEAVLDKALDRLLQDIDQPFESFAAFGNTP
jgi:hypothetical protein